MASSGGTSGIEGGVTPVGHQKDIKKEEPADEDYFCKSTGHIVGQSVVTLFKFVLHIYTLQYLDSSDDISGEATSGSAGKITPADPQIHPKNEEPEDGDYIRKKILCINDKPGAQ